MCCKNLLKRMKCFFSLKLFLTLLFKEPVPFYEKRGIDDTIECWKILLLSQFPFKWEVLNVSLLMCKAHR